MTQVDQQKQSADAHGAAGCRWTSEDFCWGVAPSPWHMMEGEPPLDEASLSIQHTFSRTPGNGPIDTGIRHDLPLDEEIALLRELGVNSVRIPISWARVRPEGTGEVSSRGLDEYEVKVDTLLEAGIEPFPYLYNWNIPAALQDRGGWSNRECTDWFSDYADVVFHRLGDRISRWLTLCEPWSIVHFGHLVGEDAPGIRDVRTAARTGHHLLLGHARAVQAFRAAGGQGQIGLSTVWTGVRTTSESPADRAAAARADDYLNRLYLDPILHGRYPRTIPSALAEHLPPGHEDDLAEIATPIDFLGVVYYMGMPVVDRHEFESRISEEVAPDLAEELDPVAARHVAAFADLLDIYPVPPSRPVTALGWEIYPEGLTDALTTISRESGLPLYVAETGGTFDDLVQDGQVHDDDRVALLAEYLHAAELAVDQGVDLRGWNVFALCDDADYRFGLIHVDRTTGQRTIKASGHWYRRTIRSARRRSGRPPHQ